MSTDWWGALPAVLVAALVVFAPGLALGAAVRLRGFALVALSPALTFGFIGIVTVALGFVHVPWTPLVAALAVVVLGLILWGVRRALRLDVARTEAEGPRWMLVGGVAAGALAVAIPLAAYIGAPDAISQTNDAIFHFNAIRWAVDTGEASSLLINHVQGSGAFYPAAWHGAVSLVVQLGIDMPVAVNAVVIVLSALVWPLGMAWMLLVATRSRVTAGLAGLLSAGFATFPLLMLQWGVLYPNHLSLALLPAGLAVVASLVAWVPPAGERRIAAAVRALGLVALAVAAIALSQPSTLLPLVAGAWLFGAFHVLGRWRDAQRGDRIRSAILLGIGTVATAGIWIVIGSIPSGGHWREFTGRVEAAWQVLTVAQLGAPPRIALALLIVAGLVFAVLRPSLRWLAGLWVVGAVLYIAVAAITLPLLRGGLVGAWYEDPYRVAAVTTIGSVPLAAIGLEALVRLALRSRPALVAPVAAVVGAVVLTLTIALTPTVFRDVVFEVGQDHPHPYSVPESDYLDADERALFAKLPELVEADATIIGNPSSGVAFGYAFSGMNVLPRTWSPPDSFLDVLSERFRDAAHDPEVCDVIEAFGADYALDFGLGQAEPGRWLMPGFTGLDTADGFELVAREGHASLWRITACD